MRKIAVLGSTGSIGVQTLDIIRNHPTEFEVIALSCFSNLNLLQKQIDEFHPSCVCVGNSLLNNQLRQCSCIYQNEEGLIEMIDTIDVDVFVIAIVGFAGLRPTLQAIKKGKVMALANKESLVVAGGILMDLAKLYGTTIYPIDSEHSAIFQTLVGEDRATIEKIILTASGGPFRTYSMEAMKRVTLADAIQHPNWRMGEKITIDSATMMNKGFEVIEARWLFDVDVEAIEVVIHPQSIIHSAVQFCDGAIKAQLGLPDMHLPIQYALFYPQRIPMQGNRVEWQGLQMQFDKPSMHLFPCLQLAIDAAKKGGNLPCILNAANEVANASFRQNKLHFVDIAEVISFTMNQCDFIQNPTFDELLFSHQIATDIASNFVQDKFL